MTFEKLKELIEKYNIPSNVKLLSDSGCEYGATEMDGVYYNEKRNYIIFTEGFKYSKKKYLENKDYKELRNE